MAPRVRPGIDDAGLLAKASPFFQSYAYFFIYALTHTEIVGIG